MQNLSQVVNLFHHENKQKLFPKHESYIYLYINTECSRQKYNVFSLFVSLFFKTKPYNCS